MNQTTLLFLSSNGLPYFRFDVMRWFVVANHVDSSPEQEKKIFHTRFFQTGNKQQEAAAANIPNNNKVPTYITQLNSPSSLPSSYKKPTPISSFTYIYPYLIYSPTFKIYTHLILPRQNPFRSSISTV